jgi:YegS/Rv2252/BmrU family lipid kinase
MRKILFVINPAGHGGAGIQVWEQFQSKWPDRIAAEDVHFTERQGHAREIAASAEGYDVLAAVGGDGTVGELMSGVIEHRQPHPKLAVIPAGTGNDIARNLGAFPFENAVAALHGDHARAVDLMRIDCQLDGRTAYRYAFLMGTVGFSAQPMVRPWMKRLLGPAGAYYLGVFLQIIAYRAPSMTVRWGEREHSGRVWIVTVGNVERTSGGTMCVAPGASYDDGELNVAVIPSRAKLTMLTKMLPKAPSGAWVREPGALYFPAKRIEVDSDPPGILDVDGDLFGTTPATFTVCPRAVQVLCPRRGGNSLA